MFKVPGPSVLEGQILHDIEIRTGLHYKRIGGIDTSSKEVAESVLPVALEWVHLIGECPERDVLQQLFTSSHAGAYLTEIISWWKRDASRNGAPDTVGYLSEALARVANVKNAKQIWSVVRDYHGYPGEFNLLVKLSALRATQEAVCGTLAESLESMQLRISDYETIVRAKCPQVQAWFLRAEEQLPLTARSVAARARRRDRKETTYKSSLV